MQASLSKLVNHFLKFTAKSVEDAKKENKSKQYSILQDLNIINYIINATNVKQDS